jgi:plasmid stabilization system protein ParE
MKVFLSELAEKKLVNLLEFLTENWSVKVKNDFIKKLSEKIEQISNLPESCIKSSKVKGLYKCVITKQTTFYYRINLNKKEIEIITIFDTRQEPNKLYKELNP